MCTKFHCTSRDMAILACMCGSRGVCVRAGSTNRECTQRGSGSSGGYRSGSSGGYSGGSSGSYSGGYSCSGSRSSDDNNSNNNDNNNNDNSIKDKNR